MGAHAEVRQGPYNRPLFEESVTVLDTLGFPPAFRRSPLAWVIRWNAAVVLDSDTSGFRDIAAQLFLSPRTVAYHLYKAYPKLGIASRAELPALV